MEKFKTLFYTALCISILFVSCSNKLSQLQKVYNQIYSQQSKLIDSLKKYNIDLYRICEDDKVKEENLIVECQSESTPIFKLNFSKLKSESNILKEVIFPIEDKFYLNSYRNKELIGNFLLRKKGNVWEGDEFTNLKDPFNKNSTFLQAINKYDLTHKKFFYINYYPYQYVIAYFEKGELKIIRYMQVNETQLYKSFDIWVKEMRIDKIDISKVDNKYY